MKMYGLLIVSLTALTVGLMCDDRFISLMAFIVLVSSNVLLWQEALELEEKL